MERMEGLYQTTLAETQELLDPTQIDHAAKLIANARQVDIYTGSHNLYPAGSTTIASYAPNRGYRTVVGNKKQGISLYNQFTL